MAGFILDIIKQSPRAAIKFSYAVGFIKLQTFGWEYSLTLGKAALQGLCHLGYHWDFLSIMFDIND